MTETDKRTECREFRRKPGKNWAWRVPEVFDETELGDTVASCLTRPGGWPAVIAHRGGEGDFAFLAVDTSHGTEDAEAGDWIILGESGDLYVVSDERFRAGWEPLEPAEGEPGADA